MLVPQVLEGHKPSYGVPRKQHVGVSGVYKLTSSIGALRFFTVTRALTSSLGCNPFPFRALEQPCSYMRELPDTTLLVPINALTG